MSANDSSLTNKKPSLPTAVPSWKKRAIEKYGGGVQRARPSNTVFLAIDCSGSMAGVKIALAKEGAIAFAKDALSKGYQVGLIGFPDRAVHYLAPVSDIEAFRKALHNLSGYADTEDVAGAIRLGSQHLSRMMGDRVICLVTDGYPVVPGAAEDAIKAAKDAHASGIDIMTIGTQDADYEFLAKLASRKELASKVEPQYLARAMEDMARLLPGPDKR